jgi:hypothetical protein
MNRRIELVVWLLVVSPVILGSPSLTLAGPKEDVAAATKAGLMR